MTEILWKKIFTHETLKSFLKFKWHKVDPWNFVSTPWFFIKMPPNHPKTLPGFRAPASPWRWCVYPAYWPAWGGSGSPGSWCQFWREVCDASRCICTYPRKVITKNFFEIKMLMDTVCCLKSLLKRFKFKTKLIIYWKRKMKKLLQQWVCYRH